MLVSQGKEVKGWDSRNLSDGEDTFQKYLRYMGTVHSVSLDASDTDKI